MAQIRMFLVSMVLVSLATGIDGTQHLMFSSVTGPVNVTRAVCQQTELCVAEPESCDPEGTGNCLFVSILAGPEVAPNGTELTITMRGCATDGEYIAFGLTVNPTMGLTEYFICGGNDSFPGFFTRELNNTMANATLTPSERVTKNIRRNVTAGKVRCQFTIPNVNSTTSSNILTRTSTNFDVILANGTLMANGFPSPDAPNIIRITMNANLSNPNALTAQPTAMPATMTTSSTPPSFGSPVSLLLCAVLAWLTLLRM